MPYSENNRFTLFGGGGFGDQGLLMFPAHDAVKVYTRWNALDDSKHLTPPAAIEQFLRVAAIGKVGGR